MLTVDMACVFYGAMFVLGAVIGSFLNVVILRHEKGIAVTGRSACMSCKHTLRWFELVPILSYILQKGRCRSCTAKLSVQYPLCEIATGVLFVLVAHHSMYGDSVALMPLILGFLTWSILIVITVYDLRTKLIPNLFNVLFAGTGLLHLAYLYSMNTLTGIDLLYWLAMGPALYAPFYILWKMSDGRWIGLGDGKFAWGMGWLLGPIAGLSAVMFAFWIGAVVSLIIIGVQRIFAHYSTEQTEALSLKSEVPFGPYLVLGTGIAYFTNITILTLFL